MARIFIYDGREFPDPNPKWTVDQVRQNMASFFGELSNAESSETKRGEDTLYTFTTRVGKKGNANTKQIDSMVNILRTVPAKRLKIIELANEIPIVNGEFDEEALENLRIDINLAVKEAQDYGAQTISLVSALVDVKPL